MKITRRQFLKGAMVAGAGLALPTLPVKWNGGYGQCLLSEPRNPPVQNHVARCWSRGDPGGVAGSFYRRLSRV